MSLQNFEVIAFFEKIIHQFRTLSDVFPLKLSKVHPTCPEESFEEIFREKTIPWFQDSDRNKFGLLSIKFQQGCQSRNLRVQRKVWWKKLLQKKHLLSFLDIERWNFEPLSKVFHPNFQHCFLPVNRNFLKVWTILYFRKKFHDIPTLKKFFSEFCSAFISGVV